jgi:hypothetical protein
VTYIIPSICVGPVLHLLHVRREWALHRQGAPGGDQPTRYSADAEVSHRTQKF